MANRIFDVCRQEVTHTEEVTIPSLENGDLLGCKVKQAQCFVNPIYETDNTSTIQVQVALKVAYKIKSHCHCEVTQVIKPFVFTATANLSVPDNATVSCEVENPTCESTQLENGLVETTVHAFIKLQSLGSEPIVIPFVASCPVGLCPTNTAMSKEHGSNNSSNEKAVDDKLSDNVNS